MTPRLFIISGPSGVGKGTLIADLRRRHPDIYYSVSATTRAPREGETNGVQYLFLSSEEFERLIAENGLIEYAVYCKNYYGTPARPVEDALASGRSVILEIETEGMRKAVARFPDAVTVFIAPPDPEALEQRLRERGTETEETIRRRLEKGRKELSRKDEYRFVLVNDDLNAAKDALDHLYRVQTGLSES